MAKRRLIDIGKCKSKPFELSSLRQTLLLPRPKMDRTAWLDPLSRLELYLACSSADESHRCNILDGGQNVCVVLYADRPEPRVEKTKFLLLSLACRIPSYHNGPRL